MWLLYLLFWTAVRASNPLYGKLGGVAVLTPDHVGVHITDITWKHGSVVAMEWRGGKTSSHENFKVRSSLDTRTGEMTITELTKAYDGIYTATINTNLTSQTKLLVISPVPKPTISVKWDTKKTTYTFTCDAKVTDAGPVTFWWKADYRRWTSTSRQTQITKEDKEEWFSCIVVNPVSSHSSDEIFNPFLPSSKTWIYILVAVILAVGIFGFLGYKYKTK